MRPGSLYGSGRSSTAVTTLKIALLAPIPSARTMIAPSANPGFLRSTRNAYFRSCQILCIQASYRARFLSRRRAVKDVTKSGHVLFQRFGTEAAENKCHTLRRCRIVASERSFAGWYVRARAKYSVMARALLGYFFSGRYYRLARIFLFSLSFY